MPFCFFFKMTEVLEDVISYFLHYFLALILTQLEYMQGTQRRFFFRYSCNSSAFSSELNIVDSVHGMTRNATFCNDSTVDSHL